MVVQVQGSAVGKICIELLGFLLLNSSALFRNVGHVLLQLVWSLVPHETHLLSGVRQLQVLWFSEQLPHLSCSSVHSLAMWFHPWHLRHLTDSFFVFSTWHLLLQIVRPFTIDLLAASALLNVISRCAVL